MIEDLVYLWVRRPVIEAALRRAAAAEPGIELRAGETVQGITDRGIQTATEEIRADVVVDALGRYRTPAGWERPSGHPTSCGSIYYCRYFEGDLPTGPGLLNPRGDLGYMGFNTFRGDCGTFAVILLVPERDRELRALREERVWMAVAEQIQPLGEVLPAARPITDVQPMGGLANILRDGDWRAAPVGDAFCHTDPSLAYGLSFSLAHARELARSGSIEEYLDRVRPEATERYALACAIDDARVRRYAGERLDLTRRDGCYPLFAFIAAVATAPQDDLILRRTVGRIGLLDRVAVFDEDAELHDRIERRIATLPPPPSPGPPRDELLRAAGVLG